MDLKEELHDFLIWLDIDNDVHEVHNLSIKEIIDEYLSSLPEAEKGVTNEEVTIKAVAKEKNPYSKECPNRHLWEEGFINGYNFGIDVKSFLAQSDQIKEAESSTELSDISIETNKTE